MPCPNIADRSVSQSWSLSSGSVVIGMPGTEQTHVADTWATVADAGFMLADPAAPLQRMGQSDIKLVTLRVRELAPDTYP